MIYLKHEAINKIPRSCEDVMAGTVNRSQALCDIGYTAQEGQSKWWVGKLDRRFESRPGHENHRHRSHFWGFTLWDRSSMEYEMGEACITYGRDEKCIQNFSRETWENYAL